MAGERFLKKNGTEILEYIWEKEESGKYRYTMSYDVYVHIYKELTGAIPQIHPVWFGISGIEITVEGVPEIGEINNEIHQ